MLKATGWALLICVLVISETSYGQYRRRGGGGGGGTVAGSYLNGMGNLIASEGQYNLLTSQANINQQQANALYIQNRLAATKAYFDMRQINREAREAEHSTKPPTSDSIAHYYDTLKPKKLTPSQLDPVSGEIAWPTVLQDETYASYRDELQSMFKLRAQHHDVLYKDVHAAASSMQAELQKNIDALGPQDYETGHRFIEALDFESHYPAG